MAASAASETVKSTTHALKGLSLCQRAPYFVILGALLFFVFSFFFGSFFPCRGHVRQRRSSCIHWYGAGAQKCGTTAMYDYICQHPSIARARRKEPQFFAWNWKEVFYWLVAASSSHVCVCVCVCVWLTCSKNALNEDDASKNSTEI